MNISLSKDIEPLSEFRKKSADFVKRLKKDKQPIVLTQHGKSAAVLMDVSEYERIAERMEMLEDLLEAKQQVEQGNTFTMDEAKERIEKHLSKWK
ncbi:MAG TPA: prevent-host-death family protein [Balneola sp.]|jgi:prevent-host-death family protein|nr:prevent-host-death family protein [Balneola sp.]MAO76299.1 prevent-host-death family protein [Balneola sp.]MBF65490.1 prevent-host-death family protein [Balneola sp.]HAH52156.1 prevent-host-death family protein [Balneola sp.]HAW78258.1 prevent-host-death family protein [Balneola sp.]|tara:strand:- start:13973 stop:14257 length:285 start_codon:yes stop_codon:yes gene_type:complete